MVFVFQFDFYLNLLTLVKFVSHLLFFSSPKDVLRRLLQDHLVEDHEVGTDIEEERFASQIQHCDTDKTAMLTIHAPMIFSRLRKAVGISHRDFLNVSSFHMDKKTLDTYIYFFSSHVLQKTRHILNFLPTLRVQKISFVVMTKDSFSKLKIKALSYALFVM